MTPPDALAGVAALSCAVAVLLAAPGRPARMGAPPGARGTEQTGEPHGRGHSRSTRSRPRDERRAVTELPHLVGLVAVGIESGAPVPVAVVQACRAHGGAAAERLRRSAEAVAWGADPVQTWAALGDDPALAPLGRALARSSRTGASVVRTLAVLADDLAADDRAEREDAARRVGVRAAVPLGVCLLPAFLLLGIVPLVAGLAATVVER